MTTSFYVTTSLYTEILLTENIFRDIVCLSLPEIRAACIPHVYRPDHAAAP